MPEHTPQLQVLVGAAYALSRAGLRAAVESDLGLAVAAESTTDEALARGARETQPDVILIDYTEPCGESLTRAAMEHELAGVVVLGASDNLADELLAWRRGSVRGVALLSKEAGRAAILGAIRAASAGLTVFDTFTPVSPSLRPDESLDTAGLSSESGGEMLTGREREVLQLVAQGMPNKQVAARLGITQHTVKFHLASILTKLNASSRTEAVLAGIRRGDVAL